ncbi:hypothetical protein VP01_255g5 [Puccinia sorghi]|uniref:DH domain-containing protein n=1 Tax=Puccinia sorghi TaxID=27349 RepID=A0A0L6V526_9BASI|nr:hypothetical protein VP01_255g5 [Puccinia sorghi]
MTGWSQVTEVDFKRGSSAVSNNPTDRKIKIKKSKNQEMGFNQESILWVDRIQANCNSNNIQRSNSSSASSSTSFHSSQSQLIQLQPTASTSSLYSTPSTTTSESISPFPSSLSSSTAPTTNTNRTSQPPNQEQSPTLQKSTNRTRAIEELVKTEATYASDLTIICDVYLYRSSGPPPAQPPLSTTDRQIIFSNIQQLSLLAQSLADALLIAHNHNNIGSCFIQYVSSYLSPHQFMIKKKYLETDLLSPYKINKLPKIEKLFSVYCSKYAPSNKRLEDFMRLIQRKQKKINKSHHQNNTNKLLDQEHIGLKYLNECKKLCQGRTNAWDLPSLLIKPVQRCLKYSLLLDQIIKYTEADDPDLSSLIQARDGMVAVADGINEVRISTSIYYMTKRRHEVVGEMIGRPAPLGTRYTVRLGPRQSGGWPSPPKLSSLIGQVRASFKALDELPGQLISSQDSIVTWILAADRLVDAFKHVFSLKTHHRSPTPAGMHLADLESYQYLVLQVVVVVISQPTFKRERIKGEIIPRIKELKLLYNKPMMLIEKYERRTQLVVVPVGLPSRPSASTTNTDSSTSTPVSPTFQPHHPESCLNGAGSES